ncbi:hypothetical protein Hanom_Chr01g00008771 [Helianthus anomalus]
MRERQITYEMAICTRVNYIVSPCGLHKITYLGINSLKSPSRVLTFHVVTFGVLTSRVLT